MRSRYFAIAILLACFLFAIFSSQGQGQSAAKPVWEYKVVFDGNSYNEKKLNEFGSQGWELSGIQTVVANGQTTGAFYYFKRAK